MACGKCSCEAYSGGACETACENCGHSAATHTDVVAKAMKRPHGATASDSQCSSITEPPSKRPTPHGEGSCGGGAAADCPSYWSGSTLRNGLKVFSPREWRIGEDAASLHAILKEDGVCTVPCAIPEAAATAFENEMEQASQRRAPMATP